jgi:hypothetical protein
MTALALRARADTNAVSAPLMTSLSHLATGRSPGAPSTTAGQAPLLAAEAVAQRGVLSDSFCGILGCPRTSLIVIVSRRF